MVRYPRYKSFNIEDLVSYNLEEIKAMEFDMIKETFYNFTRTHNPDCGPLPIVLLDKQLQKMVEKFPDSLWGAISKNKFSPSKDSTTIGYFWGSAFRICRTFSNPELHPAFDALSLYTDEVVSELYSYIESSLLEEKTGLPGIVKQQYDCKNSTYLTECMISEAGECLLEKFGYPSHLYMSPGVYSNLMCNMLVHERYPMPRPVKAGDGTIKELLTSAGSIKVCQISNIFTTSPQAFLLQIGHFEYQEFFPPFMVSVGNELIAFYGGQLVCFEPKKQLQFINLAPYCDLSLSANVLAPKVRVTDIPELEPKDNSGREKCFWCGKPTVKKECFTSTYDFCEDCKK